jgi:hypothetical protein
MKTIIDTADYKSQALNTSASERKFFGTMKTIIPALLLCILSPLSHSATDVYEYANTVGPRSYPSFLSITQTGAGFAVNLELPQAKAEGVMDGRNRLTSYRFIDEKEKIDVRLERTGNNIEMTGVFKNEKVKKTIRLDDAPWCQILEVNFSDYIASAEIRFFYWALAGYQNEMYKMEAEKLGTEKITINGKEVEAVHVLAKPTGIYALFWHCDFWFRKSDGMYLRYEAYEGVGAPLTITTLKKKTTIDSSDDKARLQANVERAPAQKGVE